MQVEVVLGLHGHSVLPPSLPPRSLSPPFRPSLIPPSLHPSILSVVAGAAVQVKVRDSILTKCVTVRNAAGRPHKHDGECDLKRGLPPQVIRAIQAIYVTNPRIKLR